MKFESFEASFQGCGLVFCLLQDWSPQWQPEKEYGEALKLISLDAFLKRKQDFVAGRLCAQKVLEAKNILTSEFLPKHSSGRPLFPEKVCGSISHTEGCAVSVAADQEKLKSVGVDIESFLRPETWEKIKKSIVNSDEELLIEKVLGHSPSFVGTLIFSAKEALYKAYHPLLNFFFGFEAFVCTQIDFENNEIFFRPAGMLSVELGLDTIKVCFVLRRSHVLTFTGVPSNP